MSGKPKVNTSKIEDKERELTLKEIVILGFLLPDIEQKITTFEEESGRGLTFSSLRSSTSFLSLHESCVIEFG